MVQASVKSDIIRQLQRDVLSMQGSDTPVLGMKQLMGLGPVEQAFPNKVFPVGAVHEFISTGMEDATATNGFIAGVLNPLMQGGGMCLWVGTERTIYPPALRFFGITPDRVIFVDAGRPKEALWIIEEGLKCTSLTAVVGELRELGFTESRRLQLAVEQSRVTGFIHRYRPRAENTVACVTRWKIRSMASVTEQGMPGVGAPRWNVNLLKVRNGKPGSWQVEWGDTGFRFLSRPAQTDGAQMLKTG